MQDIETPDNPDKGPSWPAGQAPSDINDSARAMMAGPARADLAAMARRDAARDILMAETGLMDPQEAAAGFPELLRARCSTALHAFVERASRRRMISPSEYIRQSLFKTLCADGFDPAAIPARDAGSLYNVVDGKRAYALLSGDHVADISYHAGEPSLADFAPGRGDRVLPVDYVDSEPFDITKHWRLPPIDRIEAGRVVREFQVVPKSWEHM